MSQFIVPIIVFFGRDVIETMFSLSLRENNVNNFGVLPRTNSRVVKYFTLLMKLIQIYILSGTS